VAQYIGKHASPRHGIPFSSVPAQHAQSAMHSYTSAARAYGPILDCVYEMADMIAESNGVSHDAAISQVLKDEKWSLLAADRATIIAKLKS
jgi:hypothetical protein